MSHPPIKNGATVKATVRRTGTGDRMKSATQPGETVMIPVAAIEFREGGNTLWIHGPQGGTVLRFKTLDGVITSKRCANGGIISHGDAIIRGDLEICVADPDADTEDPT